MKEQLIKLGFEKWLSNLDVAPYPVIFWDIPLFIQISYIQKYLREVHNIHVDIRTNAISGGNYFFYLSQTRAPFYTLFVSEKNSDTYEEALEYALKESLKLIK